jgi:Bacterial Ig-like domain/Cohesin domain
MMNLKIKSSYRVINFALVFALTIFIYFVSAISAQAASLNFSPSTGVYSSNGTFSVNVVVSTDGQAVNAAEGTISFNPKELSVVSVSRSTSVFNLWIAEPSFSNSAGTISFSGGLPSGYSGKTGNIMTITFRAAGAGTARASFKNGSVLANDGRGTNILTTMNGGTYTIQANAIAPEPEVIEYIAPANTPAAPNVTSATHEDSAKWHTVKTAALSWVLPANITGVRTLLNDNPTSIPTKVYDDPISNITLEDLPEGVSYFHVQFRNKEGWGKVTHYRLAVDSQNPTKFTISNLDESDTANPSQTLKLEVEDETSLVKKFKIKIDSAEAYEFIDELGSSTVTLPALTPGYHTVIIEALDEAGNSIVSSYSFTISAFDKPIFTDFPSEINEDVIPVIKGQTRPDSKVKITITKIGSEPVSYEIQSDATGEFIFIPEGRFSNGVYELTARATDKFGAQSDLSDAIRVAVQQPGYLRIGSFIVSILSVFIPLLVLLFLLFIASWYMLIYARKFRRKVRVESVEALEILHQEFTFLGSLLETQSELMQSSRKTGKLTKAEDDMIKTFKEALATSQTKVEKEIIDVTELTRNRNKN